MLIISQEAFDEMAALRRADYEQPFIVKTIRERGDPLAQGLAENLLRREVRETLAACKRLELTSDVDPLTLCMLEITRFAGLRHHRVDVHSGLRVVALLEDATRYRHDARLIVHQVDLVAVLGAGLGRLRILAAWLLAGVALGLALGLLGLEHLLLGLAGRQGRFHDERDCRRDQARQR